MIEKTIKNYTDQGPIGCLQLLLACLRAQYWSYQESHWRFSGADSYGYHLMFKRLYKSVREEKDTLAEKMVAAYGPDSVKSCYLMEPFMLCINRWSSCDWFFKKGLLSENDLQVIIKATKSYLAANDCLSLGMDDFLSTTANSHESNQYLLLQAMRMPSE